MYRFVFNFVHRAEESVTNQKQQEEGRNEEIQMGKCFVAFAVKDHHIHTKIQHARCGLHHVFRLGVVRDPHSGGNRSFGITRPENRVVLQ